MKVRLSSMVSGVENMWVSTIHSMCVKILRSSIGRLSGYNRNFSIYSDIDKTNVIKRILDEQKLECDKYLKNSKFYISDSKNKDMNPAEFKRRTDVRDVDIYAQVYYRYEEELKKSNALDFDDLLLKTFHLLDEDEEVLNYYAERFYYVHIDEFQDTNEVQLEIARLLSSKHKNLFAVGDDDQSIYGWRGAEIKNILGFEKSFPGAKVHKLEQNYRSTKKILDLANTIIAGNTERRPKKLWTENADGDSVVTKIAENENEEAAFTALQIKAAMTRGKKASDFAVLMRINAISRAFEQEFTKYAVPYKVFGGFKFFERKEIKDLTAYLRILTNPLDNESVLRIINVPKRGIGDRTIEVLLDYAKQYDLSVFDGIVDADKLPLSPNVRNRLSDFRKTITLLTMKADSLALSDLFAEVVTQTNFMSQFDVDNEENYGKKMNVNEYQNAVSEFAKQNPGATLSDYLNSITLSSDGDESEDGSFVTVATIHSVKGLEFDTVFVCGLDENVFPVSRATNGLADMEEERRLMYVAVTRAEKKLYLTRARSRFLYGNRQFTAESCFLSELSDKLGLKRQFVKPLSGGYSSDYSSDYSSRRDYSDIKSDRGYGGSGYGGSGYGGSGYGGSGYGGSGYGGSGYGGYSSGGASYGAAEKYLDRYSKGRNGISASGISANAANIEGAKPKEQGGAETGGYKAGIKVKHVKFGEGTVIATHGSGKELIADVAFKGVGIKSLAVRFAPLEIIGSKNQ